MRQLFLLALAAVALTCCNNRGDGSNDSDSSNADSDSTLYGLCGEGTAMHTLQLITALHDTLYLHLDDERDDSSDVVVGGLLVGDRMAVIAQMDDNGAIAQKVINITSLLGTWQSIDRTFEIAEDGVVKSNDDSDDEAWTDWRILNGQLLLNSDTFDILTLTADTLELENTVGIYAFARRTAALDIAPTDSVAHDE